MRRALVGVHRWLGLALGLYVIVLSVSGSVLVYRVELDRALGPRLPAFESGRPTLRPDEIEAAAASRFPGHTIARVSERVTRTAPAFVVSLSRAGVEQDRYFDAYTGDDLGPTFTGGQRGVLWLVRLHAELLSGRKGRWWNGVLGAAFTLLVLAGAVIWWPGLKRWRRGLLVNPRASGARLTWDLHNALGIWGFAFMAMWGISGWYLGMPGPFTEVVESLFVAAPEGSGDEFLAWLTRVHFGRFRGNPYSGWLKAVWVTVGVIPAAMVATGLMMWSNRAWRRFRRPLETPATPNTN